MRISFLKLTWKFWLPLAVIFVIAIALVYSSLLHEERAKYFISTDQPIIEITEGQTISSVAKELYDEKMIKSEFVFKLFSMIGNQKLRYGLYQVPAGTSIADFISMFSSGKNQIYKITITEGWRREQIAVALDKKGIADMQDFLDKSTGLEEKLFPDTYYFKPNAGADLVVKTMEDNYFAKTANLNLSKDDLIFASVVQRETSDPADMLLIAGILKNRLAIGMRLQSDPTGRYARDTTTFDSSDKDDKLNFKFWGAMTSAELNSNQSPYNTYTHVGLPIAPICNPGLAALSSVKNYQKSDYLFFLSDSDGVIHPATTYAEHQANAKKYLND